jgi:hypothetical protein
VDELLSSIALPLRGGCDDEFGASA